MIPDFEAAGNLPAGIHDATWNEFANRYGTTAHRRRLLDGLQRALESLRDAGCVRAYINGSFVTAKDEPGDFDACWEAAKRRLAAPGSRPARLLRSASSPEGEVRRRAVPRGAAG